MLSTHRIIGINSKPIALDLFINQERVKKPIVIFCHGYKGFKDWGAWQLVAEHFANAGFNFVKFNFSYNGTTPDKPKDFADLTAFGNNNYVKELDDLGKVIDWVEQNTEFEDYFDTSNIYLIGHSRGGGIAIIRTAIDQRIKKLATWASVSDFHHRLVPNEEGLKTWRDEGAIYVKNARTGQELPHYYQFYESLQKNLDLLNLEKQTRSVKQPMLIVHGDGDEAVSLAEAKNLAVWNPKAKFIIIPDGTHTFKTKHPWEDQKLSDQLKDVVDKTLSFYR